MRRFALIAITAVLTIISYGYALAIRDPVVRTAKIRAAEWPAGAAPVKVLMLSDIHVAGPDMPPSRLRRIVTQLNELKPDLILIAGDLISEKRLATRHYSPAEVVEPLKGLRAPLGVIAVLGNHDYWAGERSFRAALRSADVAVLTNQAVSRGPLVIGGVGDEFTGHADIPKTFDSLRAISGPRILVTHDPGIVPDLPAPVLAVFAGHTHCGQAYWPWGRPIVNVSRHGMRFQCGDITDRTQRLFVTAGLGTSGIWLRYGAPPDVWLVTIGG